MGTEAAAINSMSSPRTYQAGASSPAVQALAKLRHARRLAMASRPAHRNRSFNEEDWSKEELATSDAVATTIAAAVARASHVLRTNRKAVLHHSSDTEQEDYEETQNDRWDEDSVRGITNRLTRMLRTRHWARRHAAAATAMAPVSGAKDDPLIDDRIRSVPQVRCGNRSTDSPDRALSVSVLRRSLNPGLLSSTRSGMAKRFRELDGVAGNVIPEHNHSGRAVEAGQFLMMGTAVEGPNSGDAAGGQRSFCAPSSFQNTTSMSSSSSSSSMQSDGEVEDRRWSAINAAVMSGGPLGIRSEIERSRRLLQRLQMVGGGLQQRRSGGFKGGSPEGRAIWGDAWVWARLAAVAMSREAVKR
ncbi:hypothetical protein Vretimale_4406 [Volvox reticuliferus]|uniref:Uncharacterized protein n=1 Tax=Volvox reticuliferus TaxID=1737510 RepID=A0A8J4DDV3_9CHLO|nr:hypothetical protein Vretifemale_3008 [Volvox reticuliferus]GIL99182.1 hypothetical protein Vretimale_4406 [Volvox reticuliferus]